MYPMADQSQSLPSTIPNRCYDTLPSYSVQCEDHRILWCIVQGDCEVFKVTPPLNIDIDDLKAVVHAKSVDITRRSLLPKDLILWKVWSLSLAMTISGDSFALATGTGTLGTERYFREPRQRKTL